MNNNPDRLSLSHFLPANDCFLVEFREQFPNSESDPLIKSAIEKHLIHEVELTSPHIGYTFRDLHESHHGTRIMQ